MPELIYGWDVEVDDLISFATRQGLVSSPVSRILRPIVANRAVDHLRKVTGIQRLTLRTGSDEPIRTHSNHPDIQCVDEDSLDESDDDDDILMLAVYTTRRRLPLKHTKSAPSEEELKCLARVLGFKMTHSRWRVASD